MKEKIRYGSGVLGMEECCRNIVEKIFEDIENFGESKSVLFEEFRIVLDNDDYIKLKEKWLGRKRLKVVILKRNEPIR